MAKIAWRFLVLLAAAVVIPACHKDDDDSSSSGGGGGPPPGPTKPPAPTNIRTTPGPNSITIEWDAVPGATGYTIKSSTESGGSPPGTYGVVQDHHQATIIVDDNLDSQLTYFYVLQTEVGLELSDHSPEVSAKPLPGPPQDHGSITFATPNYFVSESTPGGSVVISVQRTGGSSGRVTVDYATADGTATAGTDYTAANGTFEWLAGDMTDRTITIMINNNPAVQGNRTFNVNLTNFTGGATQGTYTTATVTITEP